MNPRPPESQSGALPTELRLTIKELNEHRIINAFCSRYNLSRQMARPAGFEPATLGLEGRCSIQMSYGRTVPEKTPLLVFSNVNIHSKMSTSLNSRKLVGEEGFEPPTSCTQSRRATRLRYSPIFPVLELTSSRSAE